MKRAKRLSFAVATCSMLIPAAAAIGGGTGGEAGGESPSNAPLVHVWHVDLQPDQNTSAAGRYAFKDNLLFEDSSQFTAEAFGSLGFGQAAYTVASVDGATLGFSSTMSNGQATLVWNGVLRSNGTIIGTLVWTRADGSVGTYHFTGEVVD